ncbi:hypothetical protein ABGB07_08505 [Micromonosporaceae bacterium B7E4]
MRDAVTPPEGGPDARPDATPTPQQHAAAVRAGAAEILARVQEWRYSQHWRDNDTDRRRYQLTVDAVSVLDDMPDLSARDAVAMLSDAVRPVLKVWRPARPGPEQAILAAVERLQNMIDC